MKIKAVEQNIVVKLSTQATKLNNNFYDASTQLFLSFAF